MQNSSSDTPWLHARQLGIRAVQHITGPSGFVLAGFGQPNFPGLLLQNSFSDTPWLQARHLGVMALQHAPGDGPTNMGLVAAKLADPISLVDIGPVVELFVKVITMATMPAIPAATATAIIAIAIRFTFDLVTFTRPISFF